MIAAAATIAVLFVSHARAAIDDTLVKRYPQGAFSTRCEHLDPSAVECWYEVLHSDGTPGAAGGGKAIARLKRHRVVVNISQPVWFEK